MKKACQKYKEMLKKRGDLGFDGAGKQSNQASIAEEAVEELCDILSVNLDRSKRRFSDA